CVVVVGCWVGLPSPDAKDAEHARAPGSAAASSFLPVSCRFLPRRWRRDNVCLTLAYGSNPTAPRSARCEPYAMRSDGTFRRWSALPMLAALLAGCASAPTGPSVMVLPGYGKSFEQFNTDDVAC